MEKRPERKNQASSDDDCASQPITERLDGKCSTGGSLRLQAVRMAIRQILGLGVVDRFVSPDAMSAVKINQDGRHHHKRHCEIGDFTERIALVTPIHSLSSMHRSLGGKTAKEHAITPHAWWTESHEEKGERGRWGSVAFTVRRQTIPRLVASNIESNRLVAIVKTKNWKFLKFSGTFTK